MNGRRDFDFAADEILNWNGFGPEGRLMQNPAVRVMAKIPGEPRGHPAQPGKKGGTLVGQKGRKYGRRRT
jgi:hypothetical protein